MFDQFSQILGLFEKGSFVLGSMVYFVFALVVVKQTTTMAKNVIDKFNTILVAFSYAHLVFSFLLILLTILVL